MEDRMWRSLINVTPTLNTSYDDLYNVANAHGYLVKTGAAAPRSVRSLGGRLFLSQSGWLMLAVPNPIIRGLFDAMDEPGIELPYNKDGQLVGHISVIRPEEVEQIGGADKITERGHTFSYQLGPIKTVVPAHWGDVSRCWFVEVKSPELEKLRKTYGLTPKPNENKFQFHFTIAVRKKKVLHENDVSKAASDGNLTEPDTAGYAVGPSLAPDATTPHSVIKTDAFSLQDEDNEPQEDLTRTDVTAQGPSLPCYSGKAAAERVSLPVIGHYEQVGKITRQAFGYISPKGKDGESFAQCGTCALWNSKDNTCDLFGPGVHVPASASCNYYLHGSPKEALVEEEKKQILTPTEAGFVDRQVRCENCAFADTDDPASPYCELYEKMNDAFPSVFDLDKKIEAKACCSFNTERGKKVEPKEKAKKSKTLAVDLDGTICEYDGWKGADHFGKPRGGVIAVLKKLKEAGHTIIVWTTRGNTAGVKAHLDKHGVPYDHINVNPNQPPDSSDKMIADAYVDDRAVSARPAWPEIQKELEEFLESH